MDIKDLRYFCMTAEMEHVTKAAEKLGVSQPFLTRVIGNLEKEIGLALFDNVGRKIRLNENGENFYIYAKKVLAEVDNLYAEIDSMLDKRERNIRILCNISSYSAELIVAFKKAHPNYTLTIDYASAKEINSALAIGDADFAFCTPPIIDDPIKGIKTDLVFCERCSLLFPPDHPLIGKKNITFDDIKDEQLLTTPKGSGLRINIDRVFQKYDFHPQIVCESNDMNMIMRSVRDGMGYAIIPRWLLYSNPSLKKYCVNVDIPEACGYIGFSYNTNPAEGSAYPDFKSFAIRFLSEFKDNIYNE
ncbi:MAG: LysR family transcriptional regulator [Clostridiales bacterium]|jgi:LysR family transcriptional activator of glutamate synthase operon|nr:LysR family transcriptional regulator [Clostridiales bacterium]